MLFWRVPTTATSHRLGGRMSAYHHGRHIRSVRAFNVCRLNKHHMVSIAVGLGVITLLLVIFAYHGGYGVGSWFYSLLVVLSGLAFVVFGPLLLCRFLMHAYYRQLEARTMRLRATAQTQTGDAMILPPVPHVYACIIIAQDDDGMCPRGSSRLSDLPTYDEAVSQFVATGSTSVNAGVDSNHYVSACTIVDRRTSNDESSILIQNPEATISPALMRKEDSCSLDKEDNPPPSYGEALAMIRNRSAAVGPTIGNTTGVDTRMSISTEAATPRIGDIGGEETLESSGLRDSNV